MNWNSSASATTRLLGFRMTPLLPVSSIGTLMRVPSPSRSSMTLGSWGTNAVDANGNKVAVPTPKVTLNDFLNAQKRVAELGDTVARLAATVKEQPAQIQKVSAQVEVNKP
jgi:hypothetical protein